MKLIRICGNRPLGRSGQALIEFTFVATTLLLLVCGLIDFSRAISVRQVVTSLTREGSNLASRNTSLSNTIAAVVASASPLNMANNGRIIVSVVTNNNGAAWVASQMAWGGLTTSAASKVGNPGGAAIKTWIPATIPALPQPHQTIYVTEIYYSFQATTPIGRLLKVTLPTRIYDVAYF
jgi:Flp pilus assembly protein TadG